MNMKKTLQQALGILMVSGMLSLGFNALRADGIPLVENRYDDDLLSEEMTAGLPAISLEEARAEFTRGRALFVDARAPEFYRLEHIPGAANLPVHHFEQSFFAIRERLAAAPRVIVYCDGASCEMSVDLAEKLLLAGVDQVAVFPGGMQQWQRAGQPVAGKDSPATPRPATPRGTDGTSRQ